MNIFSIVFIIIHILLQIELFLGHKIILGPEDDLQGLQVVRSPGNLLPLCLSGLCVRKVIEKKRLC